MAAVMHTNNEEHFNQSSAPRLVAPSHRKTTNTDINLTLPIIEDNDMEDAFEKLDAGSTIGGLIVPIAYSDPETGEKTDMWGSIDKDGLFDVVDDQGRTHPLMHPMALKACLDIAVEWKWVSQAGAQTIQAKHRKLMTMLHTPHITTAPDGSKMAQVLVGFAQMAQRFKVGAYGAMVMDSQGSFLKYATNLEIMNVMMEASTNNTIIGSQVKEIVDSNRQIIGQMAGEMAQRPQPNVQQAPPAQQQAQAPGHRQVQNAPVQQPVPTHRPPTGVASAQSDNQWKLSEAGAPSGPNTINFERYQMSFNGPSR